MNDQLTFFWEARTQHFGQYVRIGHVMETQNETQQHNIS